MKRRTAVFSERSKPFPTEFRDTDRINGNTAKIRQRTGENKQKTTPAANRSKGCEAVEKVSVMRLSRRAEGSPPYRLRTKHGK